MKSVIIIGTKWQMYLTELPIIALLAVAIYFNKSAEGTVKLYPLIFACSAAVIFIFIYLMRAVIITNERVRSFGPFSSKESSIINEGKTLVLTTRPHTKLKIELFGYDSAPTFDWMQNGQQELPYLNLYRDTAVGGSGTVRRVLKHFGVPKEDIDEVLSAKGFTREYDAFLLKKTQNDESESYSLEFTKTI